MIPCLPPLQTLRAFEAAARHLCYSRAAEELSLTHGAISHHIARLEKDLGGVQLFVRDGQRMLLTDAGQTFVMDIRRGLGLLGDAVQAARTTPRRTEVARALAVSVLPSFATHWLVPRLSRFQSGHPRIDIGVHTNSSLATLDARDGIDMAIRYGQGRWHGLQSSPLMKSQLFPVCSPEFLARTRLETPADLLRATLLRNPRQKWTPWFSAAGLDAPEPTQGPVFDDAGLLLQAAAAGQGIGLARSALAADGLAAGRLVSPFDIEIEDDFSWFVVWREPHRCDPADFGAFRAWLDREARVSPISPSMTSA